MAIVCAVSAHEASLFKKNTTRDVISGCSQCNGYKIKLEADFSLMDVVLEKNGKIIDRCAFQQRCVFSQNSDQSSKYVVRLLGFDADTDYIVIKTILEEKYGDTSGENSFIGLMTSMMVIVFVAGFFTMNFMNVFSTPKPPQKVHVGLPFGRRPVFAARNFGDMHRYHPINRNIIFNGVTNHHDQIIEDIRKKINGYLPVARLFGCPEELIKMVESPEFFNKCAGLVMKYKDNLDIGSIMNDAEKLANEFVPKDKPEKKENMLFNNIKDMLPRFLPVFENMGIVDKNLISLLKKPEIINKIFSALETYMVDYDMTKLTAAITELYLAYVTNKPTEKKKTTAEEEKPIVTYTNLNDYNGTVNVDAFDPYKIEKICLLDNELIKQLNTKKAPVKNICIWWESSKIKYNFSAHGTYIKSDTAMGFRVIFFENGSRCKLPANEKVHVEFHS